MKVSAIIVTRGDQDITPVLASLPEEWEFVVWDNGRKEVDVWTPSGEDGVIVATHDASDLAVYGRYAAIEYATGDLIYVQDDDCVVSDPQTLVRAWRSDVRVLAPGSPMVKTDSDHVVCNMPPEFRHEFYEEHALVGFGACFHRDAPARAFMQMAESGSQDFIRPDSGFFYRTCDIVFTALTPRVLVDVPVENLPWAYHYDRMYRQPELLAERVRMLDLVRQIR